MDLTNMTLDELNALVDEIKVAKANLKAKAKEDKANVDANTIANCNKAIEDGLVRKGSTVVVLYKGAEVTATVVTEPSVDRASINCTSLDFDGKVDENGEKRRYIAKDKFVKIA